MTLHALTDTAAEEDVVSEEVAERELERFAEAMELDLDPRGMDQEDLKGFRDQKRRLIRAMKLGRLVIDENGQPVYTTSDGERLVFHEPLGSDVKAQDLRKQGHQVDKTYAVLAEMTGKSPAHFNRMKQRDLRVCQALFALFFS